jgi:hypothetical protein
MGLVTTREIGFHPSNLCWTYTNSSTTIDATGERVANVLQIYTAGTLAKVHVRTGTVTTGDTLKVSIQGVTSDGLPDGTILATATGNKAYGTVVVADNDDNVWKEVTLTETVNVTQGQFISIVIEFNSYVAGNMQISISQVSNIIYTSYACTDITATPGTWIKSTTAASFYNCALEYSGGGFNLNVDHGAARATTVTISSSSTPDEVGNYVQYAYPFRAVGFYAYIEADNAFDMILYDASNNVLANCSPSNNIRYGTGAGVSVYFFDSSPASYYDIVKDTWYRIVVKPTTTSNIFVNYMVAQSAAALSSISGGTYCYQTSRSDEGAWTENTSQRIYIGLLGTQLHDGASTGGSSPRFGDMTGGLR